MGTEFQHGVQFKCQLFQTSILSAGESLGIYASEAIFDLSTDSEATQRQSSSN